MIVRVGRDHWARPPPERLFGDFCAVAKVTRRRLAAKHPHEINIRGPKGVNETGGSGTRPYKNMCHAGRWHSARRVVVRHEELWPHTAPTQFDILVVIFATKNS